jgi:O-antigen ligase
MTEGAAIIAKRAVLVVAILIFCYFAMVRSRRKGESGPVLVSEIAFMTAVIATFADSFHLLGTFSERGLLIFHGAIVVCLIVGVVAILYGKLRGDSRRSPV